MISDFQLKGKNILVLGLGKTGFSVARSLAQFGCKVLVSDIEADEGKTHSVNRLKQYGVSVVFGKQTPLLLEGIDLLVPSPGIPTQPKADCPLDKNAVISSAIESGLEVISEIELAFRINPEMRIIGITGTNGKTSVTTLTANILKNQGLNAVLAGNIGFPLIDFAAEKLQQDIGRIYVVELSSFQLHNTKHFKPWIGCILNIAEDHLDWHGSFKNYAESKWRIFSNQTKEDFAVINLDDEQIKKTKPSINSSVVTFSLNDKSADFYYADGKIISRFFECSIGGGKLFVAHNIQNALAAAAISALAGAESQSVETTINSFAGLEHRIEKIATIQNVDYYDDSKATNPHAAISAILAFKDKPLVLLMGGRNKGNSFKEVAKAASDSAREVLLFGESAREIAENFQGQKDVHIYEKMTDAVAAAKEMASAGDSVLLSPACASFDEFADYKHRGRIFKEVVYAGTKALQHL